MFKKMRFSTKLFVGIIFVMVVTLLISGTIFMKKSHDGLEASGTESLKALTSTIMQTLQMQNNLTQDKLKTDLAVMDTVMSHCGVPRLVPDRQVEMTIVNQITKAREKVSIPSLFFGNSVTNNNFKIVDQVRDMVGGTATIFQVLPGKLLRISTNVKKLNGERATGTYIPEDSPVYQTVMSGNTYYGKAYVVNAWYLTAYKPLRDNSGKIISVVYVGRIILNNALKNFLDKASSGLEAGIYVWNSKGDILLDVKNQFSGKNIFSYSWGNLFKTFNDGIIRYKDMSSGIDKIASLGYFKPWDWHIGVELSRKQLTRGIDKKFWLSGLVIFVFGIAFTMVILKLLIRTIVRPLEELANQAGMIEKGSFDINFSYEADDAVGTLGKALVKMVKNFKTIMIELTSGIDRLSDSAAELSDVSEEINSDTEEISKTVDDVAGSAENMNNTVAIVASAMEQATANAGIISTASNELSSTISEIAKNADNAKSVAGNAVNNAAGATEKVNALGKAADEINNVTEVITEIAEQTNLLALNATIEAARAGEAGKGFGVVANEIKALATQTASATNEIKEKIQSIQYVTDGTIIQIKDISEIIANINDIVTTIACAVSEQSVSTQEISRSIGEVATGIGDASSRVHQSSDDASKVASDMETVNILSDKMTVSGKKVLKSSQDLLELARTLTAVGARYEGIVQHCELLDKCGFFAHYKDDENVEKQGWIKQYCENNVKAAQCERKKIRRQTGKPPADNMAPDGTML